MKTVLITTNLLFILSLGIFMNKDAIHRKWVNSGFTELNYQITSVSRPQDLEEIEGYLYILKDDRVLQWDMDSRKVVSSEQVEKESILTSSNGKLLICFWENFEIDSPDEFSTVIYQREYQGEEKEIWVRRTVKPIECFADRIVAMNAFPTLEERYYEVDPSSGEFVEIDHVKMTSDVGTGSAQVDSEGGIWVTRKIKNSLRERIVLFLRLLKDN
jgi:hypothetical protein